MSTQIDMNKITEETQIDMNKITEEMNQLSGILKEAEKNEANLSGRLQESLKRLNDEHKLSSIEEAKKMLENLIAERTELQDSIVAKFNALKEKYEW